MSRRSEVTLKDKVLNLFFKRLQHFFPFITFCLWIFTLYCLVQSPSFQTILIFALFPYLFPLLCHRLLTFVYPIPEGGSYIGLDQKKFSPWLASLRIQQIYLVFPILERLLFFLPGMYSTWLRLWGAKVGPWVLWVPGIEIADRSLIEVGGGTVFGSHIFISSHLLRAKDGKFFVYVKKVKIGNNCFIGAFSRFGPGTEIDDNTVMPAGSDLTMNKSVEPQKG